MSKKTQSTIYHPWNIKFCLFAASFSNLEIMLGGLPCEKTKQNKNKHGWVLKGPCKVLELDSFDKAVRTLISSQMKNFKGFNIKCRTGFSKLKFSFLMWLDGSECHMHAGMVSCRLWSFHFATTKSFGFALSVNIIIMFSLIKLMCPIGSVILHCIVLHCTVLHVLHCTALHCTALHCTALHCTVLNAEVYAFLLVIADMLL